MSADEINQAIAEAEQIWEAFTDADTQETTGLDEGLDALGSAIAAKLLGLDGGLTSLSGHRAAAELEYEAKEYIRHSIISGILNALSNMRANYSPGELASIASGVAADHDRRETENQARLAAMTPEERAKRDAALSGLLGGELWATDRHCLAFAIDTVREIGPQLNREIRHAPFVCKNT